MRAKELGVPLSLHAGEWPDETFATIQNVKFAIEELGARRIGHGIALSRHPEVLKMAKDKNVTIEVSH